MTSGKGPASGFGENGEHFRLAVENSAAAMIFVGADGVIRFANAQAGRMFGYTPPELAGMCVDALLPSSLRVDHAVLRRSYIADPAERPMGLGRDLRAARRGGAEFPVEIGLTPIHAPNEMLVLATIVDVTARRKAEEALALRAAELERANVRLAQFAFVASHDLQEPLRKIAAFSDLLQTALEDDDYLEAAHANEVMRNAALRARALVDDLLAYSRVVNDEQDMADLDLRREVSLALTDLSEAVSAAQARIDVSIPPVIVRADHSQLSRLLINILSNALKYRKPGAPAHVAIIGRLASGNALALEIVDDGIGFEDKYAQQIFEPFKRLHTAAKYPGTGIGLAICKSIAERHDWGLSVHSAPGEGATFVISMPVAGRSDQAPEGT